MTTISDDVEFFIKCITNSEKRGHCFSANKFIIFIIKKKTKINFQDSPVFQKIIIQ